MVTISTLGRKDPSRLLPLLREWMRAHQALSFRPDYDIAFCNWIQSLNEKDDAIVLTAEENNRLVGMAIATIVNNGPLVLPDRIGYINILVVLAESRRRGIAHRLGKALEEWYEKNGIPETQLYTLVGNEPARVFWKAQGYDVILERRIKHLLTLR